MGDTPLFETFAGSKLDPRLCWRFEPPRWEVDVEASCLRVWPGSGTDFWQRTHYGFRVDNGHFLHLEARGDFVLSTRVCSRPVHQYDQAGLMVRVSEDCWLKASVEYEPGGPNRLGVVVTNHGYSDWSTRSIGSDVDTVEWRLRFEAGDCVVEASTREGDWEQVRVARLLEWTTAQVVSCGLYACSPKGAGFQADFHFLRFVPGQHSGA